MQRRVVLTALVLGALFSGAIVTSSLEAQDRSKSSSGKTAAGKTSDTGPEEKQPHRLYDDRGTLDWRVKWADAAQIAKDRRKLVFVEMGRES